MVREFFNPRVAFLLLLFWALFAGAFFAYLNATKRKRKQFITRSRIPAIAGVSAFVTVMILVAVLQLLD